MVRKATNRRKRLSRDQRIEEILDAAYRLVQNEGISTLTMNKIALEAGSSKGLLYSYFPNLPGLLQKLYERENRQLQALHLEALNTPYDFEEMLRLTAKISRQNQFERLLLLNRLEADASLRTVLAKTDRQGRSDVVQFLSKEITDNFDVPGDIAADAVKLALHYGEKDFLRSVEDQLKQDEIWGAMMVGAMQELEKRYGNRRKKQ